MMMTGAATQLAWASPDAATVVDDGHDLDAPIVPEVAVVPLPLRRLAVCVEAPPSPASGRMHAVLVFRPPRALASR